MFFNKRNTFFLKGEFIYFFKIKSFFSRNKCELTTKIIRTRDYCNGFKNYFIIYMFKTKTRFIKQSCAPQR